ncbi:protein-L-isoaspartate O-methyltransferase [Patescibacteria group bacterium]|nr:protein-L-isoaspartate O-methyltransferase [Patescibacteria group bacterium]
MTEGLAERLQEKGVLKTPRIVQAFRAIKREDFLSPDMRQLANEDEALPLGLGQTISQPSVVAFMLELLGPQEGERVLDIGAGSGWTTALLAAVVGEKGRVVGIEVFPELAELAKTNVAQYGFLEKGFVEIFCKDGAEGHTAEAPYERILVSAALPRKELPPAWKEELGPGGTLVVPIGHSLWRFEKTEDGEWKEREYPGFLFVPFL